MVHCSSNTLRHSLYLAEGCSLYFLLQQCITLERYKSWYIKITLHFPQIAMRLLCMKPLVVLAESDITDDLAKIFSDDLSRRTRISGKTEEGNWFGIVPLGGTIHPGKFWRYPCEDSLGYSYFKAISINAHSESAITSAKRYHCFKALVSGSSYLRTHCSLCLLKRSKRSTDPLAVGIG